MSYIITRHSCKTLNVPEEVYCIHDLTEMGGKMFGKAIWCTWADSGFPNQPVTFRTVEEARSRANQLIWKYKDPEWDYKVEEYDR